MRVCKLFCTDTHNCKHEDVPFVMRYMIDKDVTGASWLTLPKGSYRLRESETEKGTHCQVSF